MCNFEILLCKSTDSSIKLATVMRSTSIWVTTKPVGGIKIMLRKRLTIETVNDELKNVYHIEHTRHRNIEDFVTSLISAFLPIS